MINKLKQYKFSPRTKEEMKNDFAFMNNQPQQELKVNKEVNNNPEQSQINNNEQIEESQKEE